MNYRRLKLMRTAARVKRVHTMTIIHPQTVGEHTFGIIALLFEIKENIGQERLLRLVKAALYHDVPEAITGDTPAPVKWKHANLEYALRHVEAHISEEFDFASDLCTDEKRLLKYCDLMELALYAMEEVETGNASMAVVFRNAMSALKGRGLTDVTPSALRLFDLLSAKYEEKYKHDLGSDTTHGFPDYA